MLQCLNCGESVPQEEAHLFAEVFCCLSCFTVATHLYDRLQLELKRLLIMSKESIRIALVKGELRLPQGPEGELTKHQLFEEILRLERLKEEKNAATG